MLDRMLKSAHELVTSVGIDGKNDGKPGHIAEMDAWRFVVKTIREMRHGIALGGAVDIDKIVDGDPEVPGSGMTIHLGLTDGAPLKAFLAAQRKDFEDHFLTETEKHGEHSHFHEDHGVMDGRKLERKLNHHTGKPEGDEREPPKSAALNHAAFAKLKGERAGK